MYPDESRFAMPVEDHSYDYKDFEGIIAHAAKKVFDQQKQESFVKLPAKQPFNYLCSARADTDAG